MYYFYSELELELFSIKYILYLNEDNVWTIILDSFAINNIYTTSLVMEIMRPNHPPPLM